MKNVKIFFLTTVFGLYATGFASTVFQKAKEGKINSLKHLVTIKKQDIHVRVKSKTPLMEAVAHYKQPNAKGAKDAQETANIDFVDYDQVIIFLLSQGASMAENDNQGRTVFHYAVSSRNPHLLELLLNNINRESERAFNISDINDITPLHLAAQLADEKMVRLLGDAGAKVDVKTRIEAKMPIDIIGELNKTASNQTKAEIRYYLQNLEKNPIQPKPIKRLSIMPAGAMGAYATAPITTSAVKPSIKTEDEEIDWDNLESFKPRGRSHSIAHPVAIQPKNGGGQNK